MEWVILIGFIIIIANIYKILKARWRRTRLMDKYNNQRIVDMILSKSFWQGQNEEQLIDSLGKPLDVDQKVLKTKTKEVWKYNQISKNRYALKITLENGLVVGWDKK